MTTRFHLAVVDGPDGGWVASLPEDREVVVGRSPDVGLALDDARLSRRHLTVRSRRGRVSARSLTRTRPVHVRRARRRRTGRAVLGRRRRLRGAWVDIAVGSRLVAGATTLEVREHPGLEERTEVTAAPIGEGLGMRLLIPLAMAASMVPLALSSAGTSPWRTITWLVLPVVLVVAVVWPWLRERAARALRSRAPVAPQPPDPPDPARLLAAAHAPWRVQAEGWDLGSHGHGRRRRVRTDPFPDRGESVAVVGPAEPARAMARWLVCQAAYRLPPAELRITAPPGWDWVAALPHTAATGETVLVVHDLTAGADRWTTRAGRPAHDALGVVIATSLADVPPWCTRVVEVVRDHDRRVSASWASEVAAALARTATGAQVLPGSVALTDLLTEHDPAAVLTRWRARSPGLQTPLGVGPDGACWLDLAGAGPHALVAGTTGAGKSELLTALVLGLAVRHPPADLHVLLGDYTGGATFGALATLPHVTGLLTDLDTAATGRALASLRAELARRERVLAEVGARSIAELAVHGGASTSLPRLLVVVVEFRTLADGHPELLDALVRLAAQGRSLGVHLVLATQRPAGAVTADMRANISIRLCLRVLEATDSLDVLGDAAAAHLPAVPGRAILRTDVPTTLQVAWPGTAADGVASLVSLVLASASLADPDLVASSPPWAPPLPERVDVTELGEREADVLSVLVTDLPEQQRLGSWGLPLGESLLVSGPPGSGRTTTARTLATEAVSRGVVVHTIADEPLCPADAPARGTVCPTDDVARAHLLLTAMSQPRDRSELLVLDDVDALCRSLDDRLGYGAGMEMVTTLVAGARRNRLGVVVTVAAPATRWAAVSRRHLVLAPRDVSDALVAGVPRDMVAIGSPPGRGVLLEGGVAVAGHVALAAEDGPWARPAAQAWRVLPLPDVVDLPASWARPRRTGELVVGLGGTDASPVTAPLPPSCRWLVLGGARTGRTTTLRMLVGRLRAHGRPVWTDPAGVPEQPGDGVLVLDDVDRLGLDDAAAAAGALARGAAVVATARPEPLSGAFHDLARMLRDPDVTLVLGSPSGTTAWTGLDLRTVADGRARPGRGVLVARGTATPIQVDRGRHALDEALARHRAQMTVPDDDDRLVAAIDEGSSSPTITAAEATSTPITTTSGA